jgi:hypothetical protein
MAHHFSKVALPVRCRRKSPAVLVLDHMKCHQPDSDEASGYYLVSLLLKSNVDDWLRQLTCNAEGNERISLAKTAPFGLCIVTRYQAIDHRAQEI